MSWSPAIAKEFGLSDFPLTTVVVALPVSVVA
jgi:hypothetical protein